MISTEVVIIVKVDTLDLYLNQQRKLISSPGSLFLNRNVHSISSGEENAAPTRWAITPSGLRGTATIGMEPSPKVFKKSERYFMLESATIWPSRKPPYMHVEL